MTKRNSALPKKDKKPDWLKVRAPSSKKYFEIKGMLKDLNLATVCQEANCPNTEECWSGGTATIMLMGDTCTRACRFCSVKTGNPVGILDPMEPRKVAYAVGKMESGIDYVVLTSVNRDDLPDEGSGHFAETVRNLKNERPELIVEVLVPDFSGKLEFIKKIIDARPDVYAHNLETVEGLTSKVRDNRASYSQSLNCLKMVKEIDSTRFTKTSIMLGLGETKAEIQKALDDLRKIDVDVVTFGQYLRPTSQRVHLPVEKYVTPDEFNYWKETAEAMGFLYVASGPLVRSSYKAHELFLSGLIKRQRQRKGEAS